MSSTVTFVCETPESRAFAADCLLRLAQLAADMTADITEASGALRICVSMSGMQQDKESSATDTDLAALLNTAKASLSASDLAL